MDLQQQEYELLYGLRFGQARNLALVIQVLIISQNNPPPIIGKWGSTALSECNGISSKANLYLLNPGIERPSTLIWASSCVQSHFGHPTWMHIPCED